MINRLDLQHANVSFDLEIGMFQAICSAHGIHCGAPEDLSAFPWQISREVRFQEAVSGFIGRLQQHARLDFPFANILSITVLGVSGSAESASSAEFASPVSLILSFLVSLGGWSEADLLYARALEDELRNLLTKEAPTAPTAAFPADDRKISQDVPSDDFDSLPGRDLHDLILRLERSNLELRQQLESIDQRIRLIVPPENRTDDRIGPVYFEEQGKSASQRSAGSESARAELQDRSSRHDAEVRADASRSSVRATRIDGSVSSIPIQAQSAPLAESPVPTMLSSTFPSSVSSESAAPSTEAAVIKKAEVASAAGVVSSALHGGTAAVLAATGANARRTTPAPSPVAVSVARDVSQPVVQARTRHLTDEEHRADQQRISAPMRHRRMVQAAVFLFAALTAGGVVTYNAWHKSSLPPAISSTRDGESRPRPVDTDVLPDSRLASRPSPTGSGEQSEARPPTLAHTTIYSADAGPSVARSGRPTASVPSDTFVRDGDASNADSSAGTETEPGSGQPLNVSSSIMAQRLVSSVPPAYPRVASMTRLQGVVVLKATIAKDGTVERVRALGGHYLLRGAAASAVRNWRYKPYYLNGKPVEVATLVTIDFALSH